MGFLDRVARQGEYRSGLATPADWLVDALGGTPTTAGKRVTVQNAIGLATVWSAVSMVSESVAMCPLKVYREFDDGTNMPARQHRCWTMLHDKPNPVTPSHRFWSTVTAHYLLWGNAFLEKRRSAVSGLVEELWLLAPENVTVEWNGIRKRFKVRVSSGSPTTGVDPQFRYFSEDDVLHIAAFSLDGIVGESVISRCKDSLGTAMAREEYEGAFYRRGAVNKVALKHPKNLSSGAQDRLRERWDTVFGGSKNAGGTVVLEEGMDATVLSMPLSDMQFIESKQLTRTEVAVMFHIPPSFLGGTTGDSLTYATVESNKIQYADQAVAPRTNAIAKALHADASIFPQTVFYPEFELGGLLRGDAASRTAYYKTMFEMDAMTRNEIRAKENLSPSSDGDKFKSELAPPPPPPVPPPDEETPPAEE